MKLARLASFVLIPLIAACAPAASTGSGGPAVAPAATTAPLVAPATAGPAPESAPKLPASVVDKNGATVSVKSVDRVVSLNGDITEIIFALGLGSSLVGVDTSATYPADAIARIPKIGYQRTLNAEGILGLTPSLVIGTETSGPAAVLEQLKAAGTPVAISASPMTLDAPAQKIRFVASAMGVPNRGEELIRQLDADIAAVKKALDGVAGQPKPKALFLYLRGAAVQDVAGANTTGDAIIRAAGGVNAVGNLEGSKPLSAEILATSQPDVLIFLDAGLESVGGIEGLVAANPAIGTTPAVMNKRILSMEDQYLLGLGPRTGKALMEVARAFYPSLR